MSKTITEIQQEINAKKQEINKIAGGDENRKAPDPLEQL